MHLSLQSMLDLNLKMSPAMTEEQELFIKKVQRLIPKPLDKL
jgi:hypothetical protein